MDLMDKTYNNKGTTKVKDFQKLSYKEVYFTFQSNSTKYNKPFKFISWPNFLEGHHILSREIWGKTFTGWFKKCSDGYIFSNSAIYRMSNAPNVMRPRCKEREKSHPRFIFSCKLSKTTLDFISELIHLNYSFNIPFKISFEDIIIGASSLLRFFSIPWWCTVKYSTHNFRNTSQTSFLLA